LWSGCSDVLHCIRIPCRQLSTLQKEDDRTAASTQRRGHSAALGPQTSTTAAVRTTNTVNIATGSPKAKKLRPSNDLEQRIAQLNGVLLRAAPHPHLHCALHRGVEATVVLTQCLRTAAPLQQGSAEGVPSAVPRVQVPSPLHEEEFPAAEIRVNVGS